MQALDTKKKDIINFFLKNGLLVSNDLLGYLEDEENLIEFSKLVKDESFKDITVLGEKVKELLGYGKKLHWTELEKLKAIPEKKRE